MRTLTHDAYTVGWICALPTELAASITMLDEEVRVQHIHLIIINEYESIIEALKFYNYNLRLKIIEL